MGGWGRLGVTQAAQLLLKLLRALAYRATVSDCGMRGTAEAQHYNTGMAAVGRALFGPGGRHTAQVHSSSCSVGECWVTKGTMCCVG